MLNVATEVEAAPAEPAEERSRLTPLTLVVLALIALAVRIFYCTVVIRHYLPVSDDAHYNDIALKISQGKGFATQFPYLWTHPTAFRPPLYPLLLGAVYWVTGDHIGVGQGLNVLIGTGVVVLTAVLTNRIAGRTAALIAAGLVTIYPPLLANDGVLLTEPLSLLLLLLTLLGVSQERYWLAGMAAGALVLTRPSAQLFVPVLVIYLLWRVGWRRALVTGVLAVVVVMPWVVRNTIVMGKPVLVTSNGFNLAAIWSPLALKQDRFVDPVRDPRFAPITQFSKLYNLKEVNLDATLRKEGLRGIKQDPRAVPHVLWNNVKYLFDWRWKLNDSAEKLDGRNIGLRHWTLPFVYAVMIAGVVGLWRMRHRREGPLLILTALYFVAVALVTVSPPRLRAPFDLLCCIAVGVLVTDLLRRRAERRAERQQPVPAE